MLWLWHRPVGTVPIGPLAWEPPYAAGAAQEIAKKKRQKKKYATRIYGTTGNIVNILYISVLLNVLKFVLWTNVLFSCW